MKNIIFVLMCIWIVNCAANIHDEISLAEAEAAKGNLKEATSMMKEVVNTHPESADAYAQYGLYLSQRAGQESMMEAGMLTNKAFTQFNEALVLEPGHVKALLNRGILGVNIPKFLGKLKQGIADLENVQKLYGSDQQLYMVTSYYLGIGYQKAGNAEAARAAMKFVVTYGRDTQFYSQAKAIYDELPVIDEETSEGSYDQGMKSMEAGDMADAVVHFRQSAKENPDNLELHLLLAQTLGSLAEQGYDESIQDDVTTRAGIANEVFEVLSHCVELAPDSEEIRFLRGSVAINLPFFVNSLETGIQDLTYLAENSSSQEMRTKANFLKEQAILTRKVNELAEKGYLAETESEKEELLTHFIETTSPVQQTAPEGDYLQVVIRLGYRDQIEPQTAVWIEDNEGNYLKTLYISGFAASVKEKQKHLPQWAGKSKFEGVEAVTSASINCGRHTFYWDFVDNKGNIYLEKEFVVCAEICHWPHVQYSKQELKVNLAEGSEFKLSSLDFLIPEIRAVVKREKR
ncbi:MAG: DUF2271 domain-containing protein [Candidatus Stygibacter frigidus]|nr:DUF2271 domain-containing protein [Candidatus Stygibacter frigidus]